MRCPGAPSLGPLDTTEAFAARGAVRAETRRLLPCDCSFGRHSIDPAGRSLEASARVAVRSVYTSGVGRLRPPRRGPGRLPAGAPFSRASRRRGTRQGRAPPAPNGPHAAAACSTGTGVSRGAYLAAGETLQRKGSQTGRGRNHSATGRARQSPAFHVPLALVSRLTQRRPAPRRH